MMKNYAFNYLCFLVLLLMLVSCQKDELFKKGNPSSSPNFEVSRISFEEVPHKNEAAALIEKIHKKENNSLLQGKGIYDSINKFTVHTDRVISITKGNENWLTFIFQGNRRSIRLKTLCCNGIRRQNCTEQAFSATTKPCPRPTFR